MKDYYNTFVDLSLQGCKKDDYADKQKVKKNNAAFKKLYSMQDEMRQNVSEEIWYKLLNHEDDRVKVHAATFCLKINILVEQAIVTLEKIRDDSGDSTISFSAKMVLQLYKDGSLL
ncbi:MAG: DUF2019 domain-containing protein [Clostridiales bacterium]|nr:DUF2019 domain-containing protein [Clostridiales bacterium]